VGAKAAGMAAHRYTDSWNLTDWLHQQDVQF